MCGCYSHTHAHAHIHIYKNMTGEAENKLFLESQTADVLSALVQITGLLNSCNHVHAPVHTSISWYVAFFIMEL